MIEGADSTREKGRAFGFLGITAFGITLVNLIRTGLSFWPAAQPESMPGAGMPGAGMPGAGATGAEMPRASATNTTAQPIFERYFQTLLGSQPSAEFKPTAEPVDENFLSGVGSRISSAAGTAFAFANGLSWTTMGVAGFIGAVGALYLVQRYWKGCGGGITNTNNNNVNINIHFTGINPGSPPIIEQKVDKNGTNLFVKMPEGSKFRKAAEQVVNKNRNSATAA